MTLKTTADAASLLACHPVTVSKACQRLGIAKTYGRYLLTDDEIVRLRGQIGAPNRFQPGNTLGLLRKNPGRKKKSRNLSENRKQIE